MNKRYSITLLLVAFCFFAFSQHAILKGFTYDESTGESLPYCTVQLMGTNYGALSDVTGAFLINKIPAGTYTIKVSRLGYVDLFDTVAVGSSGTITKRYSVSPNSQTLDAVQIVGENTRKEQETRTSVISVTPKDMSKMPAIGGQPDFAQLPEVKEWLKTHHAKKLTRQESWSNRYEGFKGKHYYGCIYIDKFGESGNTFPTDKEIGDTELFYLLEERTVSLHQKRSTPKRDQKSEEQKNKERAQRANKKEARELAEMCFNLRKQFVDGLALTKQNTDAVLMGATKLISYYCQSHSQWHSDGVSELLGLGKFEYGKKVKERVQKIEKGEALKLIYACFGDSPTTFPGSMQTPDSFVSYDTSFGFEIVLLYDWLVSMGYEMSTEEAAMMDGSHELYHRETKGAK